MVHHATTSNSFSGGLNWLVDGYDPALGTYMNGGSALFIVGRNVGEIHQLGLPNQKLWHAGGIRNPNQRFKDIASKDVNGRYDNPNLYLDGIEYVGGVDEDHDGKVTTMEVNLTEWQYECAEQITRWHARHCEYELTEASQLIHQDIAADKPDLSDILDEIFFRLFRKKVNDMLECKTMQETIEKQSGMIVSLIGMVKFLLRIRK